MGCCHSTEEAPPPKVMMELDEFELKIRNSEEQSNFAKINYENLKSRLDTLSKHNNLTHPELITLLSAIKIDAAGLNSPDSPLHAFFKQTKIDGNYSIIYIALGTFLVSPKVDIEKWLKYMKFTLIMVMDLILKANLNV